MTAETDSMTLKACESVTHEVLADGPKHLRTAALRAYSDRAPVGTADEKRIVDLLPMVNKIARRAATYIKPPLSFEDLVSAGTLGLLKAARDFDSSRQAEFSTYAYIRIKGAILDELRSTSLLPQNLCKQIRAALEISRKTVERTGKTPSDEQIAQELGISLEELYVLFEGARVQQFISIDDSSEGRPPLAGLLPAEHATSPSARLEKTELLDRLTESIGQLDPKRRQIIVLYYRQHLTMRQIADVLQITESRVSQLHAGALFHLSVRLRQWKDD